MSTSRIEDLAATPMWAAGSGDFERPPQAAHVERWATGWRA